MSSSVLPGASLESSFHTGIILREQLVQRLMTRVPQKPETVSSEERVGAASGASGLSTLSPWRPTHHVPDLHTTSTQMAWLFLISIFFLAAAAKMYNLPGLRFSF